MNDINIIDQIIDYKKYRSYKSISRGRFSSTIEINYKDNQKRTSVLILTKNEAEKRKFNFEKIVNPYIVKALQYEYLTKFQCYIFHTESGESSLQDKISDKNFRQSPEAIDKIFNWLKQVTLGLKKLHSEGFVHLNVRGSSIAIFPDNTAKIGGLDLARHSSSLNNNLEVESESSYWPPERLRQNSAPCDGRKLDSWDLAVLIIEVLTNNYLSSKSNKKSTWLKKYDSMYKILQAEKFRKTVRKMYPRAANNENIEKILHLIKYILKENPSERPVISEILILILEYIFRKDFGEHLKEDIIWSNKASLKKLQCEIQNIDFKNKASVGFGKKNKDYVEVLADQIIFQETEGFVKEQETQTDFQENLRNHIILNTGIQTKEKTKNKSVLTANVCTESKPFFEDLTVKKQENRKSKKCDTDLTEGMFSNNSSDEFKTKNKEIKDLPFEHADLELSRISSLEKNNPMFENIKKVILDRDENSHEKYSLRKSTDEENIFIKFRGDDYKQSQIKVPDIDSKEMNIIKKQVEEITSETEKKVIKNDQEQKIRSKFTIQLLFRKVVDWFLDEIFYTGVRQSGSYINSLSKVLTG